MSAAEEQQRTHLILNGKEHSVLIQKMSELATYQEEQSVIKKPRRFNSHLKCELCKRGEKSCDSAKSNLKMSLEEEHVNPKDLFICIVMIKDHALF